MRIALALVCLAAAVPAASLEELRRGAAARAANDLVELAEWCHGERLYKTRDETYRLALAYDPDHETARSKLRYVKRAGEWVQARPPGEPKDRAPDALPAYEERKRAVGGRYAAAVIGRLELGWRASPDAVRERVFAEIFRLDPDHERARRARGETRRGGAWVLRETVRAEKRRGKLAALAKAARDEVPEPEQATLTDEEAGFGVVWTDALQGRDWRLLLAAPAEEGKRCVRVADATRTLLAEALGSRFGRAEGMRLLVMTKREDYLAVLKAHPKSDEKTLKFDGALTGCWLKGTCTTALYDGTAIRRFEGCARQPVGFHLWGRFGVTGKQGWAWEGMGLYFTYLLTGQRLSYFTRRTRYANQGVTVRGLGAKMRDGKTDWFELAGELKRPDWKLLLAKDVNQLTNAELVWSYVLAGFVLEAFPHKAATILAELGKGRPSSAVLPAELGMSLPMLARRVPRFAEER